MPRGWDQVQSGWYIEPVTMNRHELSQSNTTGSSVKESNTSTDENADVSSTERSSGNSGNVLYDNPFMSAEVLRGFWRAHHDVLKTINLGNKELTKKFDNYFTKFKESWIRATSMPGREKLPFIKLREIIEVEDSFPEQDEMDADVLKNFQYHVDHKIETLLDLVEIGVAFRDLAGMVVIDVVNELKNLNIPNSPVLLAVDQYNTWDGPSVYHYREIPVLGRELCVPYALNFISKKKAETDNFIVKNGICIAATSMKHPEGRKSKYEDAKSSIPFVLRIPCYNQQEMLGITSYYMNQKRIGEGVNVQELLTFRMISQSNPRAVRAEAVPYFFPLSVARHGLDFMKAIDSKGYPVNDDYDADLKTGTM